MLAKPKAKLKAKVKHIYSTHVIYNCHLGSSKYFYNTGHYRDAEKCLITSTQVITAVVETKMNCDEDLVKVPISENFFFFVSEKHSSLFFLKHETRSIDTCDQFHKYFTHISYWRSKISLTVQSMCVCSHFQNALAYFARLISYTHKLVIKLTP